MPRISRIDDPEFLEMVADAYVRGLSINQMSEHFGVHRSTIAHWRRDPRVKLAAKRLHDERVMAMTRRVDAEIQRRLVENVTEMDDETLIRLRKELLGGTTKIELSGQVDTKSAQGDLWGVLDANPQLVQQIGAMLTAAKQLPETVDGEAEEDV